LDQAVLDRIVVDDAGHWLWQGWKDRNGYGQFWFKGRRLFAHRASWEAWSMDGLPKWAFVLHRCDIPACIRPDHLFLGTQADNIADAKAKGRLATGERGLTCKRGHAKATFYRRYPAGGRGCEECRRVRRAEVRAR